MPQFETQATIRTDLDDFTRGYVECALWLMTDDDGDDCDDFDGELAEETYRRIIEDCTDFQASNREDLDEVIDTYHVAASSLGHDFYLTRNGHGAGFWDRGYDLNGLGDKLSAAARAYGEFDLYVGDDGQAWRK